MTIVFTRLHEIIKGLRITQPGLHPKPGEVTSEILFLSQCANRIIKNDHKAVGNAYPSGYAVIMGKIS